MVFCRNDGSVFTDLFMNLVNSIPPQLEEIMGCAHHLPLTVTGLQSSALEPSKPQHFLDMPIHRFYGDAALLVKLFSFWGQQLILHGGDRGERLRDFVAVSLRLRTAGHPLLANSDQKIRVFGLKALKVLLTEVAGICQKSAYFYV